MQADKLRITDDMLLHVNQPNCLYNSVQELCFSVSGERLTTRLRSLTFKAMLRQEIGWFDQERNSSGILTTRLAIDASNIQGATGSRLATIMEVVTTCLFSLIIAFVYSWPTALVVLGSFPIMFFGATLEAATRAGHAEGNKKIQESAGKVD